MSTRHLLLPFVALGALALLVSGCGGDDDSSGTTTTAKKAPETTTTAAGDVSGGDASGGGAISPECEKLRESFTSLDVQEMMTAFEDGSNPAPQFEQFAETLALAEENAPSEIAGDLATMADSYRALAASADEIDWQAIKDGDPQASAAAGELMEGFSAEELTASGENVSNWLNENCIPS